MRLAQAPFAGYGTYLQCVARQFRSGRFNDISPLCCSRSAAPDELGLNVSGAKGLRRSEIMTISSTCEKVADQLACSRQEPPSTRAAGGSRVDNRSSSSSLSPPPRQHPAAGQDENTQPPGALRSLRQRRSQHRPAIHGVAGVGMRSGIRDRAAESRRDLAPLTIAMREREPGTF